MSCALRAAVDQCAAALKCEFVMAGITGVGVRSRMRSSRDVLDDEAANEGHGHVADEAAFASARHATQPRSDPSHYPVNTSTPRGRRCEFRYQASGYRPRLSIA